MKVFGYVFATVIFVAGMLAKWWVYPMFEAHDVGVVVSLVVAATFGFIGGRMFVNTYFYDKW